MPTPNLTLQGGAFENFEGQPLANGYLVMSLCHDENYAAGPYQIGAGITLRIPLDSSGNINPSVVVWSNDVLLPAGSCYTVRGYDASGTFAFGPQYWSLSASPSPYDVGNIVPTAPPGGCGGDTGGGTSIILQTNSVNNSSQVLLNLVNSGSVTFSNTSGGNVTATAAGGGGGVSGSGTINTIPKWTASTTLGNSTTLTDDGSTLRYTGIMQLDGGEILTPDAVSSASDVVLHAGFSSGGNAANVVLQPGVGSGANLTTNGRVNVRPQCAFYFGAVSFSQLATPRGNPSTTYGAFVYCIDAKGAADGAAWGSTAVGSGSGALLRYTGSNWIVIG